MRPDSAVHSVRFDSSFVPTLVCLLCLRGGRLLATLLEMVSRRHPYTFELHHPVRMPQDAALRLGWVLRNGLQDEARLMAVWGQRPPLVATRFAPYDLRWLGSSVRAAHHRWYSSFRSYSKKESLK